MNDKPLPEGFGTGPCSVCGNDQVWHVQSGARHPYTPEGVEWDMRTTNDRRKSTQAEPGAAAVRLLHGPIDPVLRQALMDKGILTPEDLEEAERKVNLISQAFHGVGNPRMIGDGGLPDTVRRQMGEDNATG